MRHVKVTRRKLVDEEFVNDLEKESLTYEDEELCRALDKKVEDDEMSAEEEAFIRGYDAERRRSTEEGL